MFAFCWMCEIVSSNTFDITKGEGNNALAKRKECCICLYHTEKYYIEIWYYIGYESQYYFQQSTGSDDLKLYQNQFCIY